MGKLSRTKGASGEREFINLLKGYLGDIDIKRNLTQYQQKNECDIMGFDDYAIEVKRKKTPSINSWWSQAESQAQAVNKIPVLAYRLDRHQWRVRVPMFLLNGVTGSGVDWTCEMGVEAFCAVVREGL